MLWTIFVILIVLWLLGFVGHVAGGFIHILLVIAVIVLVIRLIQGQAPSLKRRGIGVNSSDVAAGYAHAPPMTEGSRIRKVPAWDREKGLWCGGPKRVNCCGSQGERNGVETFSTPAFELCVESLILHSLRPFFQ